MTASLGAHKHGDSQLSIACKICVASISSDHQAWLMQSENRQAIQCATTEALSTCSLLALTYPWQQAQENLPISWVEDYNGLVAMTRLSRTRLVEKLLPELIGSGPNGQHTCSTCANHGHRSS
jgi:hypothetical protein